MLKECQCIFIFFLYIMFLAKRKEDFASVNTYSNLSPPSAQQHFIESIFSFAPQYPKVFLGNSSVLKNLRKKNLGTRAIYALDSFYEALLNLLKMEKWIRGKCLCTTSHHIISRMVQSDVLQTEFSLLTIPFCWNAFWPVAIACYTKKW